MNALATVIAIAACSTLHNPVQASLVSAQQSSLEMEKRAVADTQQIPAQDLDPELPKLPFATWFKQVAGPGAGIVWQLSECGDAQSTATGDIRACVEANTILPDGRRVILMVAVGTFKRGMTGAPAFQFGVIEQEGELRTIRRLRDLQKQLLAPGSLANGPAIKLPESNMPKVRLLANNAYVADLPAWSGEDSGQPMQIEEPPPPAEPLPVEPRRSKEASTADNRSVSGRVIQGSAVFKAQPTYPPNAKRFNASGPVEVRVTISETGRVINAVAISGHPLLRDAAVEAARKWVFKPTTVDGVPAGTQLVLTFEFTVLK